MQSVYSEIKATGADLVAICPQRPEFLRRMIQKHGLEFEVLRDEGNRVADSFNLRHVFPDYLREVYLKFPLDLPRVNGDDSWSLAMPARYLVGTDGIIRNADFDPDYRYRPEAEKTLEDLRALAA